LYSLNPLAGGFLTDRYHRNTAEFKEGRFLTPTYDRASYTAVAIGIGTSEAVNKILRTKYSSAVSYLFHDYLILYLCAGREILYGYP
jgi:hypothetical protein